MGATATIAIGSLLAGAASQALFAPKVDQPNAPPASPTQKPVETAKAATGAADQQKKRAAAAVGRSDTILTGPQGLGSLGSDQQQVKSLLGY